MHLFLTLLPLNANNELHVSINRILGKDTSSGLDGGAETDLGVDVEGKGGAAWRPDGGGEWDGVGNGVIAISWAREGGGGGS